MNGAPRKVKNPLLTGADVGFPFEQYTQNAVLMPVTPATPAVLRDDVEIDNFVGQEPNQSQDLTAEPSSNIDLQTSNTPISGPPRAEEIKEPSIQPQKQSYFTSILSSFPNLSLSSIKGDSTSSPQGTQSHENLGLTSEVNPYGHDRHGLQPKTQPFLAIDPRNSQTVQPPGSTEDPSLAAANISKAPPLPTVPPTVPLSASGGPVSYRLGNQRRLKYVPPPDLTSSAGKQYPTPSSQGFPLSQAYQAHLSIFNPNAPAEPSPNYSPATPQNLGSAPVDQPLTTPDQHSRNSSLQGSFRSSPSLLQQTSETQNPYYESPSFSSGSPGYTISSSKPIPTRIPEPATPQNTPANVSFAGFAAYRNQDLLATPIFDKDPFKDISETSTPSEVKDSISESGRRETFPSGTAADQTFTPISAARVTEKLEHLLAEREEKPAAGLPDIPSESNQIDAKTRDEDSEKVSDFAIDALSDVDLGEEPQECSKVISQSLSTVNESVNASDSNAVRSANLQQQYYQSEPAPALPGAHFFDRQSDRKPSQKSETVIATVGYPEANPYTTSPGTFFDSFANSNYSYPKQAAPSFEAPNEPANVPPQRFGAFQATPQSSATVPPPFWTGSQSSFATVNPTCGPSALAQPQPPPTFYDPTLFLNENAAPLAGNIYNPAGEKPNNQFQAYFDSAGGQHSKPSAGNGGFHPTPSISTVAAVPELTSSATLSPVQSSVNPLIGRTSPDTVPPSLQALATGAPDKRMQYRPVYHHWFHRKEVESKVLWLPFSMQDSLHLEEVHNSSEITPETSVATDGGRYDVDILRRRRSPVYWTGAATEVRRCSWFYKGPSESRYVPYDESTAQRLEDEFKQACLTNVWNRRVDLSNGEYIIFHSISVQVHYLQATSPELAASWGNAAGSEESTYLQGANTRPRVVKRGVDEFNIEDGEPEKVDHLLFLVHGIGSVCDLKFRTVEEVVDEFRSISLQLIQSHYRTASEQGVVNRIEVLPISWHATLHSEDTGIDKKLHAITLESIPKLRHFTNDTLLDILFYTSPIYCQTIIQTVGDEMNRLFTLFKQRNPVFDGGIYLGGHSLGSLILFDLLCHQRPENSEEEEQENEGEENGQATDNDHLGPVKPVPAPVLKRRLSKKISYVMGAAGTGQPFINYPQLYFHPRAFFALGSPIGMFVTVRGIDTLGEDFALPTCPAFFNVFHPFDPVAYRVESLINPDAHKFRPMLIPHHKGRKRMHLELKETMARVGADLKQKLLDSVRNTWNSVYQLALFHRPDNQALEREIDKVVEEQLHNPPAVPEQNNDDGGADMKVGRLNGGRRIDYVLQEAPFEYINEYIFALTSHVCYWESEDTMLMILKEIYGSMGIQTDAQLPQQTLSIERVSPSPSSSLSPISIQNDIASSLPVLGVDVTAPISGKPAGPPPKTGFVRKT